MRNRSSSLLRLAAVLLAGIAATYAANWALTQDWVQERLGSVQRFTGAVQSDDLTLLVAQALPVSIPSTGAPAADVRTGTPR